MEVIWMGDQPSQAGCVDLSTSSIRDRWCILSLLSLYVSLLLSPMCPHLILSPYFSPSMLCASWELSLSSKCRVLQPQSWGTFIVCCLLLWRCQLPPCPTVSPLQPPQFPISCHKNRINVPGLFCIIQRYQSAKKRVVQPRQPAEQTLLRNNPKTTSSTFKVYKQQ